MSCPTWVSISAAMKLREPQGPGQGGPGQGGPGQGGPGQGGPGQGGPGQGGPGQGGPGQGGINRRCPRRGQASPFFRRGMFPFSTTRIIGFFFDFRGFNTTALFFLFNSRTNDFFYTTDRNERNNAIRNLGYQDRGIVGFIFIDQRCGGSPLFRLFNPRRGTHFFTTSNIERANARRFGWNDEGVTGFLFRF
ncbi:hypothetical protein FPV67DRAFT_253090 [Lyophyllum atratum]|nr:hypothetical protein FPV67DRAFT_253090 [Lyophyllum atratum]